jgi:hypothetical protein
VRASGIRIASSNIYSAALESMMPRTASRRVLVIACIAFAHCVLLAEPVPVRHPEGLIHGFLVLRTADGSEIADGELMQSARGDRVTSQVIFHFKDGSLYDETTVFSQHHVFKLISDHVVMKGASFKQPMDTTIDARTDQVTFRANTGGKGTNSSVHVDLPPDLANGLIFILLKNISARDTQVSWPMVAIGEKPRLVKLSASSQGEEQFALGSLTRKANHFVVKVSIGGVAGKVAPLVGKQPPDIHAWIVEGEAPVLVKSEGPLYPDGPIWQIVMAAPTWPKTDAKAKEGGTP